MELLILISLIAVCFFSGAETAFVSASRIHLEIWSKRKIKGAPQALNFVRNPDTFLSTTLIGSNIAVVTCSSLLSLYLLRGMTEPWSFFVTTTIILIIGDIIPKTIGRDFANNSVLWSAFPLKLFHNFFRPIISLTNQISRFLLQSMGKADTNLEIIFSRQDIKHLLVESERSGSIERETTQILSRVFSWETRIVKDVMVPRTQIDSIEIESSVAKVEEIFSSVKRTKLPVYEGTIDNIRGIIQSKDLFRKVDSLRPILRPVLFTPETKRCQELLTEMQKNRTDFAVVLDEFGGTAGIVTIENVLAELVGDIREEDAADLKLFRPTDSNSYLIEGRARVEDLNAELNLNLPTGSYHTIAGFILDHLARVPKKNESFIYQDKTFFILQSNEKLVQLIKLTLEKSPGRSHQENGSAELL